MKSSTTLSLLTATIIGLTGCGGGSSSSSNTSNNVIHTVADGYIEGAKVCHDSNNNMLCTDETNFAITDVNGQYTLTGYNPNQTLLVHVPAGAIDHGPFANGTTGTRSFPNEVFYYYPAGTGISSVYISPFSTLVYAFMNSMPGMSLEDAETYIKNQLGLPAGLNLLDNHIAQSATGTAGSAQLIAEMINTALANETANSNPQDALESVLANLDNIGDTAASADATTYDTSSYVLPNTQTASSLTFTPVTDICADLDSTTANYFAFEGWGTGEKRVHKTFYTKLNPSDGKTYLHIRRELEASNAWSIDTYGSSTENNYLSKIEIISIDMSSVNSTTQPYTEIRNDLPFPAELISCTGNSATFKNAGMLFKLFASQADIAGVNGANLPQGATVGNILNNVVFQTGDLMYKLIATTGLGGIGYSVAKGVSIDQTTGISYPSQADDYIVFHEGTQNSTTAFLPMSSTNDINVLVSTANTSFVIEYRDSSNYVLLDLTSPVSSNNTGTLNVITVDSGSIDSTVPMTYTIETNNGTPFFIVNNYDKVGSDLFIGKVNSVDSNSFVFGKKESGTGVVFLTQGGSMDGDVMDDIMLNTSARNRILSSQGLTNPALP